jgi:hypothetical protein
MFQLVGKKEQARIVKKVTEDENRHGKNKDPESQLWIEGVNDI